MQPQLEFNIVLLEEVVVTHLPHLQPPRIIGIYRSNNIFYQVKNIM